MPKRPRVFIVDDDGDTIQYDDAARALGITKFSLYVKISEFRNMRGDRDGFPENIKLKDLMKSRRRVRMYEVTDESGGVIHLSAAQLAKLLGVTRNTASKHIAKYKLAYKGPIHLREFLGAPTYDVRKEEIQLDRVNARNVLVNTIAEMTEEEYAERQIDEAIAAGNPPPGYDPENDPLL